MILDEVALVCMLAMAEMVAGYGGNIPPGYDDKVSVCLEVARAAENEDLPVSIVVSVAYEESAFNRDLESKVGAVGPLQIIPRYHCPNSNGETDPHKRQGRLSGCDLIRDGVKALKWFWESYHQNWAVSLAHYNSGTKIFPSSRAYSKRVRRRAKRIDRQIKSTLSAWLNGDGGNTPLYHFTLSDQ